MGAGRDRRGRRCSGWSPVLVAFFGGPPACSTDQARRLCGLFADRRAALRSGRSRFTAVGAAGGRRARSPPCCSAASWSDPARGGPPHAPHPRAAVPGPARLIVLGSGLVSAASPPCSGGSPSASGRHRSWLTTTLGAGGAVAATLGVIPRHRLDPHGSPAAFCTGSRAGPRPCSPRAGLTSRPVALAARTFAALLACVIVGRRRGRDTRLLPDHVRPRDRSRRKASNYGLDSGDRGFYLPSAP